MKYKLKNTGKGNEWAVEVRKSGKKHSLSGVTFRQACSFIKALS